MNSTTSTASVTPASPTNNQDSKNSVRLQKRKKTSHAPDINTERTTRCFLGQVPLEVLAEILGYTSPRDILAVARTSKYFCATLVNNAVTDTKYIWKRARKAFVPEIPEPLPNFTEVSYAAFLFDKGECEVRLLRPVHRLLSPTRVVPGLRQEMQEQVCVVRFEIASL